MKKAIAKNNVAALKRTVRGKAPFEDSVPAKKRTIARSAKTGKLVSGKEAKKNPDTTVIEKVDMAGVNFNKPVKIPKNIAAATDLWFTIREHRLNEQKKVDAIKEHESALRQHLIDSIPKSLATGVAGKRVRVQIVQKEVIAVQDEDAFMKFARRKGNEDLVVERPNTKAIADRIENGKAVPGVGYNKYADISYSKL